MSQKIETHILTFSCKDQIGIVAKISSILAKYKCNIVESKQFTDTLNGNFFIRQSFILFEKTKIEDLRSSLNLLSSDLKGVHNILAVGKLLKSKNFDLSYTLTESFRSAFILWLSKYS